MPADLLVASHVIEHVPDLITWLREIASVLKPTGQARLAIPDRRYTFDLLRVETQLRTSSTPIWGAPGCRSLGLSSITSRT